jgi:hypothetical protein
VVTWYNLISDQYSGINDIVVPGTLRDSLVILAVVLEQQTDQMPYQIMTYTGTYSDVIFRLFRLQGYRFCPRIADTGEPDSGASILKQITVRLTRYLRIALILLKKQSHIGKIFCG